MAAHDPIIDALKKRQTDVGLLDGPFADRIGISRQMWQYLKTGGTPGKRSLQGAMLAYPELAPLVLAFFLTDDATKSTDAAEKMAEVGH